MAGHGNGCYFSEAIPLDFLFFEITDADQTATRVIKWSPSVSRLYSRLCENPFPGPEEAGVRVVREMRFLRLQVFCFRKAAREFSVTLDPHSKGFLPLCVLAPFCLASFVLCFVLTRPPTLADRSPIAIASAFPATPNPRLVSPRKSNRTEHDSALVANLAGEESAFREKLVALLDG